MALSCRTRFEVFKRDKFTCQYCGRISPEVILEVDHIIARASGGSDDVINLRTSCWDCNRGKSDVPLNEIITGEDPHDRAIMLLERERQLREYNRVLVQINERREEEAWGLLRYWTNDTSDELIYNRRDFAWVMNTLTWMPAQMIRDYMDAAIRAGATNDLRYVKACCKRYREQHEEQDLTRG